MKIRNILIKNFKSIIKELNFQIQEYGDGNRKIKTTFLVGINERGKGQ